MRLLLLSAAFICALSVQSYGQITLNLSSSQVETYVAEIYGENFVSNNPTLVASFGKLLNNRIEFRQEAQMSGEKYPLISSVGLNNKLNPSIPIFTGGFDIGTFNPLRYGFDFFSRNTQVFRVDGSDLLMIVLPQ